MYQTQFTALSLLSPHICKDTVFPKRQNWSFFDKLVEGLAFLLLGLFCFVTILLPSPSIELSLYSTLILALTRFSRSEYKEILCMSLISIFKSKTLLQFTTTQ